MIVRLWICSLLILAGLWAATDAVAQSRPRPKTQGRAFVLQVFGGAVLNVPTRLSISQDGYESFGHDAEWETRSFEQPLYWALRARWQWKHEGLEIQLVHHKMYLKNTTDVIEHFEVTHGFNFLTLHYAWLKNPLKLRFGAGLIFPKTDSTVRGESYSESKYRAAGPAFMGGAGYEKIFAEHFLVGVEGQILWGLAKVNIANGSSRVRAFGVHLMAGVGMRF